MRFDAVGFTLKSHSPPWLSSTCCLAALRGSRTRVFQGPSRRQECLTLENTIPLNSWVLFQSNFLSHLTFQKKKKKTTTTEEKFLLCETIIIWFNLKSIFPDESKNTVTYSQSATKKALRHPKNKQTNKNSSISSGMAEKMVLKEKETLR